MKADLPPTAPDETWLEAMLRDQSPGYIDDEGFTGQVLGALPRRNQRRTWLFVGGTMVGCTVAGLAGGNTALQQILMLGRQLGAQLTTSPLTPTYLLVGATMLIAVGSSWWALARQR